MPDQHPTTQTPMARNIRLGLLTAMVGVLGACAAKAPPPPPPPPPPVVVEAIPYRPVPPGGAVATMAVPGLGFDGVRETVNARLTPEQTIWNLRSALNVAALNCDDPQYAALVANYSTFLDMNKRQLASTNRAITQQYRERSRFGGAQPAGCVYDAGV